MSSDDKKPIVVEEAAAPAGEGGVYKEVDGAQEAAQVSVNRVRITYGAVLVGGFLLCLLQKWDLFHWITRWEIQKGCATQDCITVQGIFRVSFALWLFFFIHWLVTSPWNLCLEPQARINFNRGGFICKLLSLIPLIIIAFVIPNDFFVFYAWCALVLSVIFLVGQLIILLEFSYSWSDDWASREEQKYTTGLLVSTVVLTITALVFIGLGYHWFGGAKECGLQQGIISITLLAGLIYFPLSIFVSHGSVLPSAVVLAYTTYTMFSALQELPGGICNKIGNNGTEALVVGTVFSCAALVYATVNAATSRSAFQTEEKEETVEEAEAASFSFFHVQMMLGSAYLAMLLTDWTILGSSHMAELQGGSTAPMWAKFSSELLCILLYAWTLLAPVLCRDREFG